jgi:hypothetical protein
MTIFPRLCDLEVSDAHVGTVEVFIPDEIELALLFIDTNHK